MLYRSSQGESAIWKLKWVWQAMETLDLEGVELLIVENVGNLVCPASFDLGEDYRITLIATTEGDDKPKKISKDVFNQ